MKELFQTICQMSVTGTYVIILVFLVRLLLRRCPRRFSYFLWFLVFLRLLCPVFPDGPFSLIPKQVTEISGLIAELSETRASSESSKTVAGKRVDANRNMAQNPGDPRNSALAGDMEAAGVSSVENSENVDEQETRTTADKVWNLASVIWLLGFFLLGIYHTGSYLRLKRALRNAKEREPGVFEIPGGHLSFVLGLVHPNIYLDCGLQGEVRSVVIHHEEIHLRRKDYLIKPLALAVTCLHWFNPLVWLAFYLMNQDMEISCDEQVVRELGEDTKKIYSHALLQAAAGTGKKRQSVCALLSFGEDSVKKRILRVLQYKKASVWAVGIAAVLLLVVGSGLFFNPQKEISEQEAIRLVQEAGDYEGMETACFLRDYDKDGAKEAFVEIGVWSEEHLEGDLWYVSSDGNTEGLKRQIYMEQVPEYLEHEDGTSILISYIDGNALLTAVYEVQAGNSVELLEELPCQKYVEDGELICLSDSLDANLDREMETFSGRTRKPYAFYYEGGTYLPYEAKKLTREEVKAYESGTEILQAIENANPGCQYQYLLRGNDLLHINRAEESADNFAFFYTTCRIRNGKITLLDEGEGCYQKNVLDDTEETFADRLVAVPAPENEDWMGTVREQRTFAEQIRHCEENKDVSGMYALMGESVTVNPGGEEMRFETETYFAVAYDTLFTDEVINDILHADFNDLNSSWRGISFGTGAVWYQPLVLSDGNISYEISAINQFASGEEEESEVTDLHLQWRNLLQEQGATAARADEWWEVLKSDGLILSDSYEFTDLRTGDWDQNGKVDLAFVIRIRPGVISPESYARNTLYIYMNGKQAYYKAVSDYPLYSIGTLLGGDVDRDGYQEVVYSAFTGGVGGSGSWDKEILKYRNGNLTPMEFPDDLEETEDIGIQVEVAYGPGGAGADYYTAYCPLLDETIYFVAENLRREDGTLAESYGKEGEPAGGNVRGFYDFALVYEEAENRFYLKAYEYLCGEGGPSHEVGTAVFTLDWKTDGTPIVLDFAIEP